MIYPSIHIISGNTNIYFFDGANKPRITNRYNFLQKVIRNQKKSHQAIVILSQVVKNIKGVIKYLRKNKFDKVHFVIDDVFRVSMRSMRWRKESEYEELYIIYNIIKHSKLKQFQIYHCEKLEGFCPVSEPAYKIGYVDIFLANYCIGESSRKDCSVNSNFTKKISCLNNRFDYHRYYLSTLLVHNPEVHITLNDFVPSKDIMSARCLPFEKFSKSAQGLIYENAKIMDKKFEKNTFLKSHIQYSDEPFAIISNSFVNIIGETTYYNPYSNVSEKTIKPMQVYRPFIMLGCKGNLELLKDIGFKTFDKWWDEGYDHIGDNTERLEAVYEVAKYILKKPIDELQTIYNKMIPILEHNHRTVSTAPNYLLQELDWVC